MHILLSVGLVFGSAVSSVGVVPQSAALGLAIGQQWPPMVVGEPRVSPCVESVSIGDVAKMDDRRLFASDALHNLSHRRKGHDRIDSLLLGGVHRDLAWIKRGYITGRIKRIELGRRVRQLEPRVDCDVVGGGLAGILQSYRYNDIAVLVSLINPQWLNRNVGSKLPLSCIACDPIGSKGEVQGRKDGSEASPTKPSRQLGGISRLPLGAKVGISLIVALLAWLCFARTLRPLSLLVITRGDRLQSFGTALVSTALLWLSYSIWMS